MTLPTSIFFLNFIIFAIIFSATASIVVINLLNDVINQIKILIKIKPVYNQASINMNFPGQFFDVINFLIIPKN